MGDNSIDRVRSHGDKIQSLFLNIITCRLLKKTRASTTVFILLFIIFLICAIFCWIDVSVIIGSPLQDTIFGTKNEIPLNCDEGNLTKKCHSNYPARYKPKELSATTCPEYFRWIHQDLRPWKATGITREMVENGKDHAHFRLVIIEGKAYVEKYGKPYQTRDVFTLWGILQLLRLYPGKVPDLELMFSCADESVILKRNYKGEKATLALPPVFHYCGHEDALDIAFPDWTFWGWAETNIKPWTSMLEGIKEGNKRTKWKDRAPYAFWKGNPNVALTRKDMMKCNVSNQNDWNVHLYIMDWHKESKQGFKDSNLEDQCTYRYKIYIEGAAWSVSEKYILACDSMTLLVKPDFYDFFTRSMVPMQHYWPIRATNKCRDLKFAVEWGNNHTDKAQAIGEAGTKYIQKYLKMKYVYDYMFHLLSEYAKLLKFKPTIPSRANEYCPEKLECSWDGLWKKFMMESMVKSPSEKLPCTMPPPLDAQALEAFLKRKEEMAKQVEKWENEYWENQSQKQ